MLFLVWLLVVAVAFWLLFRVVALAVLQFFADEVVAAVEARHYPELAKRARPLPLGREVRLALRGLLRVVGYNLLALPFAAVLLFTAIGPGLVFLAVNAVLLGREFTDMAWVRHCGAGGERANPVPRSDRVVLGVGDLVDVEVQMLGSVRRCARLRVVEAGYMPEILDSLTERRRPIAAA